jgi:hypothetical protein
MQETIVLKKNPDMVSRVIDDETILLPIYKTSEEINCIYTLNKIASQVWDLIDGKRNLGVIKKQVLKKFDATQKELDKEMQKFLKDLKQIKAIKEV